MNRILKKTMLAAAGAAIAAQSAWAGNSYSANGDVLLMFKSFGAANDVIFDLGNISQFEQANAVFDLSTIGYNASFLSNVGSFGSLEWTMAASTSAVNPKGVAVTDETGFNVGSFSSGTAAAGAAGSVNNTGSAYSSILGAGILSPKAVKMPSTTPNGYTSNGDDLNGSLNGESSVLNSDFSGTATSFFDIFVGAADGKELGTVSFDQTTGQMIFTAVTTAVPEPAAYGLLAGAGLLGLAFSRQFRRAKLA